jgi:endo-1,3(4)-beta-glucanase
MKHHLTLTLAIAIAIAISLSGTHGEHQSVVMGVDLGTGLLDPSDPFSSILRRDQLVAQIDQPLIIPTPIPHHDTIFDDSDNDYQSGNNHTDEITAAVNSYKAEWGRPDSVLQPISTDPPLPLFKERIHPVKPMRVRVEDQSKPQPTNKFYGNLMLGDSHSPIWTHPYGLRWDRIGKTQHGLSISHVDDSSKAFGPPEDIDVSGSGQTSSKYYLNPFIASMGLSATELDEQHEMTVGNFEEFSCAVELTPASERALEKREPPTSVLRIPIVRGMVFISALYRNLTPQFYSNAVIRTLELDPRPMADGCVKYRFLLENGVTWLLYAKPDRSMDGPLRLEMHGQGLVVATSGRFMGLVQIAKLPVGKEDETEKVYDQAMGVYPIEGELIIRQKYVFTLVEVSSLDFFNVSCNLPIMGIKAHTNNAHRFLIGSLEI